MTADTSWVGSMPELYDTHMGPALFEPFGAELARRAAALSPAPVLELAAGTGIATRALLAALPTASITATDLNPPMVEWAAARVPGPTWMTADAQSLKFPDDCFDLVLCQFGAMFFPDRPAALAESARVLAPGGTLLHAIWDVVETSPMTLALVDSLAVLFPADPPSFVVRVPHGYTDPDQISADFRAGGFTDVTVDTVSLTGHAASARSLATGFGLGSPLRFALQERGDVQELTRVLADEMEARLGPGPVSGGLGAFIVTARV
jgi:SAM-dependent methyltransferase